MPTWTLQGQTVYDGVLTRYGTVRHSEDGEELCMSPTLENVPLAPGSAMDTQTIIDAGTAATIGDSCVLRATKIADCPPAACASGPCLNEAECSVKNSSKIEENVS